MEKHNWLLWYEDGGCSHANLTDKTVWSLVEVNSDSHFCGASKGTDKSGTSHYVYKMHKRFTAGAQVSCTNRAQVGLYQFWHFLVVSRLQPGTSVAHNHL